MCVFCKIVEGEIPCYKVYEDDSVLAFLDIAPVNPGHTLVIPKKHYQNFEEIPEELLAKVMLVVKKVGASLKNNLGIKGYNAYENNDPIAGQVIPHFHFHVIPRNETDGLELWPQGEKYQAADAQAVASKIKIS